MMDYAEALRFLRGRIERDGSREEILPALLGAADGCRHYRGVRS